MEEATVYRLLTAPEGLNVDFKREECRLDSDETKVNLVKDILCMANTPRDDSAYLLFGVEDHTDGHKTLLGVGHHLDDSTIQQLLAGWVRPVPAVQYRPVSHEGTQLGIIEIRPKRGGPFHVLKDHGDKLRRSVTYMRRGSRNSEAQPEEIQTIGRWMADASLDVETLRHPDRSDLPCFDRFYQACHRFEHGRIYVLATGPNTECTAGCAAGITRVKWNMVVDFDCDSHRSGLLSLARPSMSPDYAIHLAVPEDSVGIDTDRSCLWLAARGLADRPTTVVPNDWRSWNRRIGMLFRSAVASFVRAAADRPITVVLLGTVDKAFAQAVCESFDAAAADRVDFVFATPTPSALADVSEAFNGVLAEIRLQQMSEGLCAMLPAHVAAEAATLPSRESGEVEIPDDTLRWLHECMDVIHLSTGLSVEEGARPRDDFLKGQPPSWWDLGMTYDVPRERTATLRTKVEDALENRLIRQVSLNHWPGAGGTTIGLRLVWDLHEVYPSVVLRRGPHDEIAPRLRYIYDLTRMPMAVLVEAGTLSPNQVDQLRSFALSNQLPIVLIVVQRSFEPQGDSDSSIYVGETLTIKEAKDFARRYSNAVPEKTKQLMSLARTDDAHVRNAFYFGLTAFEADFVSIPDYVGRRLSTATRSQREILTLMAVAYHYGQKTIPAQLFGDLLGIPSGRVVNLESVFGGPIRDLVARDGVSSWRPSHQLIAREIMVQELAGSASDPRVWKENLSHWASRLVRLCARPEGIVPEDTKEILNRTLISRENTDLLGPSTALSREYSRLVQDIPSPEGRLHVLKELVDAFPDEAHFWGHLGRFYANELRDDDAALGAIDRALELAPHDNVLYHMRGMALGRKAFELMKTPWTSSEHATATDDKIRTLVDDAGTEFQECRKLSRRDESYGYVSHITLIVRALDFGFRLSGLSTHREFLLASGSAWYRDLLDMAETLLQELRRMHEGTGTNQYLQECQAGIDKQYDDYAKMLEDWNNLLSRSNVFKPQVRRQMARVYLARRNRSWDTLERGELDRVRSLMEANILEDPSDEASVRMWFQATRRIPSTGIEAAIERMQYWKTNTDALDAKLYLYIIYALQCIDGTASAREKASNAIIDCAAAARGLPNRHASNEWYGKGAGLTRIVNRSRLGAFEEEFRELKTLTLLDGRIAKIMGPEAGEIELSCGLKSFFVPNRGFDGQSFLKGRDENRRVQVCLAFTYDGPRAWATRFA